MLFLERICALHESNKESVERTSKNIEKLAELFNKVVTLVAPSYEMVLRVDVNCRKRESEEECISELSTEQNASRCPEDLPLSLLKTFNKLSAGATSKLTFVELWHILQWFLLWLPSENDEQIKHLLLEVMCIHEATLRDDKRVRRVLREIAVLLRNNLDDRSKRYDNKELTHRLLMQIERLFV